MSNLLELAGTLRNGRTARRGAGVEPRDSSVPEIGGKGMSIGELAERTGVSTRTIRYYEQLSILPPPPRSDGNVRRYPAVYITYLEGVLALKDLEFTLEEIAILTRLTLNIGPPLKKREHAAALKMASERLDTIDRRIEVLQTVRRVLMENAPQ